MSAPREVLDAVDHGWSLVPCGPDKRSLVAWKELQSKPATKQVERRAADLAPDA